MRDANRILTALVLALTCACAVESENSDGDSLGDDGKGDSSWEPTRGLDLGGAPLSLDASSSGHAVRSKLDPSTYTAVMFTAQADTPVRAFTRTWLTESDTFDFDTEPRLYRFSGPTGGDINDWKNWSQVSRGRLGQLGQTGSYTITAAGTYLVILTAEKPAYDAHADSMIYLSHGGADLTAYSASVSGTIRCGANRTPARNVQLTVDLHSDRAVSGSDGRFSFTQSYSLGRHDIYAQPTSDVGSIEAFDAVIAPDGGTIVLLLDRCP